MSIAKRIMFEEMEHDNVIQALRAKLYQMSDLFSNFKIDDDTTTMELVRGIWRHERFKHPMTVMPSSVDPSKEELAALFDEKYPGHEIPLQIGDGDDEYLNETRFIQVAETLHALADQLSWFVSNDEDEWDDC